MERNKITYSSEELAVLDADELAQLLQTQLQKPASELDDDLVRQLLRELEARGKDPTFTDDTAVEMACEKFHRDTLKIASKKQKWYRSWLITAASVAVVLGILLFTLPGTAEAENIKGMLTHWTDSVFQFFTPGQHAYAAEDYVFKTDHPGLQQIYDEVVALGITDPVVPMWVPEGFALKDVKIFNFPEDISLFAYLMKEDEYVILSIICNNIPSFQHEKDVQDIETVEVAGIDHYFIRNKGDYIIAWMIENIECSITTGCKEEDIHKLLNSIYIPED